MPFEQRGAKDSWQARKPPGRRLKALLAKAVLPVIKQAAMAMSASRRDARMSSVASHLVQWCKGARRQSHALRLPPLKCFSCDWVRFSRLFRLAAFSASLRGLPQEPLYLNQPNLPRYDIILLPINRIIHPFSEKDELFDLLTESYGMIALKAFVPTISSIERWVDDRSLSR